jgi:D-glycero-D-manno-heptose 1,7-bisphosphate phosphatase
MYYRSRTLNMRKAVFLDRDGVINRKAPEGDYVVSAADIVILPNVPAAIAALNAAGYLVLIVTNQRGIARRKLLLSELDKIHAALLSALHRSGAFIDAIYYCPHESGCTCRKPEPGMLLRAAEQHDVDLPHSWMVGDSWSDIAAGIRAGCKTAMLSSEAGRCASSDIVAADLRAAVDIILRRDAVSVLQSSSAANTAS